MNLKKRWTPFTLSRSLSDIKSICSGFSSEEKVIEQTLTECINVLYRHGIVKHLEVYHLDDEEVEIEFPIDSHSILLTVDRFYNKKWNDEYKICVYIDYKNQQLYDIDDKDWFVKLLSHLNITA